VAGLDVLDISPAKDKVAGDLAAPFKAELQVPVIAAAGMDDPDVAADAIRCGRCDLIAVGRQLIADARWPAKVEQGKLADIVPCTKCSKGCFGNLGAGRPVECVLWPAGELDAYGG
jgi:2,4-dienoyl-CoA reductase-like NADH-dependent reductase (Old Yellow Enzyme family)